VESCLRVFRTYESRWQIAGRQYDIIMELTNAANIKEQLIPNSLKRPRDDDADAEVSTPESPNEQRSSSQEIVSSALDVDSFFSLPMYTQDLSRLPIYEPMNWDANNNWGDWGKNFQNDAPLSDEIVMSLSGSTGSGDVLADSLAVLTGAPGGYDWENWGKYITSVEELTQSFQHS